MRSNGHADGNSCEQKNGHESHRRCSPRNDGVPRGHSESAEFEDQKEDAKKCETQFGRGQYKAELKRHMRRDLKKSEMVIPEPIVDLAFREHDKKADQQNPGQE